MGKQLHKRFSVEEVKEIFERYLSKEIGVEHVLALLKIGRRRFFDLIKNYRETPDEFSLEYKRKISSNRISEKAETKIMSELKKGFKALNCGLPSRGGIEPSREYRPG